MNIVSFIRAVSSIRVNIISHSMSRLILIFLSLNIFSFTSGQQQRRRQNHQVEWNSSNMMFNSTPAVINVRLGDTIDFLCPHSNQSHTATEYNTIYLVSEIDYNLCYTEKYQPLIRCDQPDATKRLVYTLSISKYLPYPNMPEFLDGRSYYFISTSNGEKNGINQKFDGLCRQRHLRLIIDVQKYYRRYFIQDSNQRRNKVEKQLVHQSGTLRITSASARSTCSLTVFIGHLIALAFVVHRHQ
jgi:plastocyanin